MKWRTKENQDVLWKTPWNPSNQDFEADQSQEDLVLCWVLSVMGGGICLHACWICWWFWLRTLWVLLVLEFVLKVCFVVCLDRWSLGVEVRCWDRDDDIEVEAMNKKEVCTCCLWCVLFVLFVFDKNEKFAETRDRTIGSLFNNQLLLYIKGKRNN